MPTKRGAGFLIVAALLLAAWFAAGLSDILAPAVLLVVAVALAVVYVVAARLLGGFSAQIFLSNATPAAGQSVTADLVVRHRLPLRQNLQVEWSIGDVTTWTVPRSVTAGVSRAEVIADAVLRGPAEVSIRRVLITDPLGLARWPMRLRARAEVLVLPALLPQLQLPESRGGVGELEPTLVSTGEPGGNLRDYRAGDALRQVHWKQSARQDRLLVNVPEQGSTRVHQVFLATGRGAYADPDADFECAVSVVATLVSWWDARGEDFRLTCFGASGAEPLEREHPLDQALRQLAWVEVGAQALENDGDDAGEALCGTIVTGKPTKSLLAQLGSGRGTLVVTSSSDAITLPQGWQLVEVRHA